MISFVKNSDLIYISLTDLENICVAVMQYLSTYGPQWWAKMSKDLMDAIYIYK